MKKILIIFIVIFLIGIPSAFAAEDDFEIKSSDIIEEQMNDLKLGDFINKSKNYTNEFMEDIDVEELFESAISGEINNNTFIKKIISLCGNEVRESVKILGSIIIIIVIHSVFKSITDSLENKSVSKITYYVQYILIVTLIMTNFTNIIELVKESVKNLVAFIQILIPLLMSLLLTTGNVTSAGVIEPIILLLVNVLSNSFEIFIIPIVLVSTAISVISKISDKIQIDKLSKFIKSSIVWGFGIILTLFVSVVSLDGTLTSTVDGVTSKTARAAVSNLVPVVGKILGDAVDTVIGCSNILKNAVGIVGIIIIIGICIVPIIKIAILIIFYHLTAALCEPIADKKIVDLLAEMGNTFKMLLAIMCSISVMMIIGTALVIKISNSSLMYR